MCLICAEDLPRLDSVLYKHRSVCSIWNEWLCTQLDCHALCIEQQRGPAQGVFLLEFDLLASCPHATKHIYTQRNHVHNELCWLWVLWDSKKEKELLDIQCRPISYDNASYKWCMRVIFYVHFNSGGVKNSYHLLEAFHRGTVASPLNRL